MICEGRLARWITGILSADAVTLGRRVFLSANAAREVEGRSAAGLALLRHERVHVAQFGREGALRFLSKYLAAYLKGRRAGMSHAAAYSVIPYEVAARAAEATELASSSRPSWRPRREAGQVPRRYRTSG